MPEYHTHTHTLWQGNLRVNGEERCCHGPCCRSVQRGLSNSAVVRSHLIQLLMLSIICLLLTTVRERQRVISLHHLLEMRRSCIGVGGPILFSIEEPGAFPWSPLTPVFSFHWAMSESFVYNLYFPAPSPHIFFMLSEIWPFFFLLPFIPPTLFLHSCPCRKPW